MAKRRRRAGPNTAVFREGRKSVLVVCRKMGREGRQGEVGLVIGDEYFAIRDFGEE